MVLGIVYVVGAVITDGKRGTIAISRSYSPDFLYCSCYYTERKWKSKVKVEGNRERMGKGRMDGGKEGVNYLKNVQHPSATETLPR